MQIVEFSIGLQFRNATPAISESSDSFQSTSGSFFSLRAHCQRLPETSDNCSVQIHKFPRTCEICERNN